MKVGFIGAGMMGRPILDQLVAGGHDCTVLTRTEEKRAAAEADGLACAGTVADTVRDADVAISVVLNDDQVREVLLGPDGAVAAMKPGSTIVQHTTSDPATAQLVADAGAGVGVRVLDAALSGGPHNIRAGELTLWVGGDETLLDELRPMLALYASPVMFVGALGNGQRVKLVNNALFVSHLGLAVDALRLAGSLGIEPSAILPAVQHGSGASFGLNVVAGMGSAERVAAAISGLMAKDVDVVRQVAARSGVDLGVLGTVLASDAVEKSVLGPARAAH